MKTFIIYSDLRGYECEWKETLQQLIHDYKHQVCVMTDDLETTKNQLIKMGLSETVNCIEVKKNSSNILQISEAQKLTDVDIKDLVIVMSDLEKAGEFKKEMPKAIITMMSYEGDQSHFNYLKKISSDYKRSSSSDFDDINLLLLETRQLINTSWWLMTPKENLEAQRDFLISVLIRADNYPNENREECILKTKASFEERGMLAKVLRAPPNITGLKWDVLSSSSPLVELIKNAEQKKVGDVNVVQESNEDGRLLSPSPARRGYGSVQSS